MNSTNPSKEEIIRRRRRRRRRRQMATFTFSPRSLSSSLRSTSTSTSTSSPPLNCYNSISTDEFSGWYAVSDETKCSDFCFWKKQSNNNNENSNSNSNSSKHYYSTLADPHQTTTILLTSTESGSDSESESGPDSGTTSSVSSSNSTSRWNWVCLLNTAGDETRLDSALSFLNDNDADANDNSNAAAPMEIHEKIFYEEGILQFEYLRCSRGANENLHSFGQTLVESTFFWSILIVIISVLLIMELVVVLIIRYMKHQKKREEEEVRHGIISRYDSELLLKVEQNQDGGNSNTRDHGNHNHNNGGAATTAPDSACSHSQVYDFSFINIHPEEKEEEEESEDNMKEKAIKNTIDNEFNKHNGNNNNGEDSIPETNTVEHAEQMKVNNPKQALVEDETEVKMEEGTQQNKSITLRDNNNSNTDSDDNNHNNGKNDDNNEKKITSSRTSSNNSASVQNNQNQDTHDDEEEMQHFLQTRHNDLGINTDTVPNDTNSNNNDSPNYPNDPSCNNNNNKKGRCCNCCCTKVIVMTTIAIIVNLFLIYVLFTAALSLAENTRHNVDLPHGLRILTPACTNTRLLCPAADNPIRRSPPPPLTLASQQQQKPFSYLITSDSQIDWYNGDCAHLGQLNYPPPCNERDSCKSCTAKFGRYTNLQMKKALEKLISMDMDMDMDMTNVKSNNTTASTTAYAVIPKTLVMNGDLTAFFHLDERERYEAIYHNIAGLEQYFPGLGNHDYKHGSTSTYNGDDWLQQRSCNAEHAVGYFRGAFCGNDDGTGGGKNNGNGNSGIPKFDAARRVTSYDPNSLSYSWDEVVKDVNDDDNVDDANSNSSSNSRGRRYHFVQVHYHPLYENARLGIASSIEWLKRDLTIAHRNYNSTNVLFVHASAFLPDILIETLLGTNVAVIFTGHYHRCLGPKCAWLRGLDSFQAEQHFNETAAAADAAASNSTMGNNTNTNSPSSSSNLKFERIEKCFPSSASLCSADANSNQLFYLSDKSPDLTLPKRKLVSNVPRQRGLCPVSPYGPFVNETDNTSLCAKLSVQARFPFKSNSDSNSSNNKTIPIFWSGSASFETFLKADFYGDRIVINMMTALEGKEGQRYIDVHEVPNAVYPFHNKTDLEEHTIFV